MGLLEIVAGSLVAVFQLKRRYMSCLEQVYLAQRGLSRETIIRVSQLLHDELQVAAALVSITSIDLRLSPSPRLVASDASSSSEAAVECNIGEVATAELHRHTLQKGLWNRLLNPVGAYRREKGDLEAEAELPGDSFESLYGMHPVWEEVVASQTFRQFGPTRKTRRKRHINIGELRAALAAEKEEGRRKHDSFYVHLQDSQVSLAALLKGRSSSAAVNRELKKSIPEHFGSGIRPFYAYVRSKRNPADDPTRAREVRGAERGEAEWMRRFEMFDEMLEEAGVHPRQTRGLPDEETLWKDPPADCRGGIELRRERRRAKTRLARIAAAEDLAAESFGPPGTTEALGAETEIAEDGRTEAESAEVLSAEAEITEDGRAEAESAEDENAEARHEARELAEASEGASIEPSFKEEEKPKEQVPPQVSKSWRLQSKQDWKKIVNLLLQFDRSQFVVSPGFRSLEEALETGPGILDLFAGSRGLSRACCNLASTWSLTFDLAHSPKEDLLNSSLQGLLFKLVEGGAFFAMVAGPVCSSFSTAITPPCRTLQYPEGTPWCSPLQQHKNSLGNQMLKFVLDITTCCHRNGVLFLVENPDSSWLWRQTAAGLCWDDLLAEGSSVGDLRLDFCRFGTPWRKRTRFRCNFSMAGQTAFCRCRKEHVILRGRCKSKNVNYTKLAEPYPRKLCGALASALMSAAGFFGKCRKLDINACAKAGNARIGEAKSPGPRRVQSVRRRANVDLAAVELLEPATIQLRAKIWDRFLCWADGALGQGVAESWLATHHALFVELLVAFGYELFQQGESLHMYRQLLAHSQREHSLLRIHMTKAWHVVSIWEKIEPTVHRTPLPEPILMAMVSLAVTWRWLRFAAVLAYTFYSASRVGEVLRAKRCHVLTPRDLLFESNTVFLRVLNPKTRNRGARTQYSSTDSTACVDLVSHVWNKLMPDQWLYEGSPSSFRSRWDALLRRLAVPHTLHLTPGSLRGGGAICAYRKGASIDQLLWMMRIQHQRTLGFYLQEMVAASVLPSLPTAVLEHVKLLQGLMPFLVQQETRPAAPAQCGDHTFKL